MLLSSPFARAGLASAVLLGAAASALRSTSAAAPATGPAVSIEHTPAACFLAEKTPRVVACLEPRAQRGTLRVLFRAAGAEAWYASPLRSDVPCYSGLLPRPSRGTTRVEYVVEAEGAFGVVRSPEHSVAVVADAAACTGRVAPVAAGLRAAWEGPAGAPRTPPGFEGAAPPASSPTLPKAAPPRTVSTSPEPLPSRPSPPTTVARPAAPVSAPKAAVPQSTSSGGHGLRNAAIIVGGAAAVGGGAVAVSNRQDGGPASAIPPGSGLPPSGVSGVYVGTETVNYGSGCSGTDDIVLNLQEAGGALTGVLSFTVRTCPCCSTGRGANPVSGSLSGTSLQLSTPIGFGYSGTFAGNRLSGSLAGPGGITGTWTADKR